LYLPACRAGEPGIFTPILEAHDTPPNSAVIVIKRLSDGKDWTHNPGRANIPFIPASTSKIPHTLIALETGQASPDTQFKWDGRERTFKVWNQDHTLSEAFQRSAVWVYQEITQSFGPEVMKSWLEKLEYGNHNIGTDENVTTYWLRGPLKTSAADQVDFLDRLARRALPLSPETYAQAWPIFKTDSTGPTTLYSKTGWMFDESSMDIGWYVGWTENSAANEIYVFALNMDMPDRSDTAKRKPIVMDALRAVGAWPE
jgi:beta-lactamase class D